MYILLASYWTHNLHHSHPIPRECRPLMMAMARLYSQGIVWHKLHVNELTIELQVITIKYVLVIIGMRSMIMQSNMI